MRRTSGLLCFIQFTHAILGQKCWFPDGSTVANTGSVLTIPCNASSPLGSMCCKPDDVCTTTGLCVGHASMFYRGGCTDQLWEARACQTVAWSDRGTNTFSSLVQCPEEKGWCCSDGESDTCCNVTSDVFDTSPWGDVFMISSTGSTTSGSIATGSPPATTTPSSPNSGNLSHPYTTILIAVSVPLGCLLVVLTGLLVWRERQHKRSQQETLSTLGKNHCEQLLEDLLKRIASTGQAENSNMNVVALQELSDTALHELAAKINAQELDGQVHRLG